MIVYRLVCKKEHEFDAWFRDSAAYEKQAASGNIACPVCGDRKVSKAIMAPNVSTSRKSSEPVPAKIPDRDAALLSKVMASVREHVETNFDYVGDKFADEARKIHYGDADERGIYGEATGNEVKDLVDEGIDIAPLPIPPEKAN